ncbi:MAG: DUF7660 family protein [Pyrinomonadaceae bacterium]
MSDTEELFEGLFSDELDKKLERVVDLDTFLDFVRALAADKEDEDAKEREAPSPLYMPGANGWQNNSIAGYLEAALASAEASRGLPSALPQEPSWKAFAEFLYRGRFYE